MSRLNLELRPYGKVLWKIKLKLFSTVNIFHQRKNIQSVINIALMLFLFLAPILDRFKRCFLVLCHLCEQFFCTQQVSLRFQCSFRRLFDIDKTCWAYRHELPQNFLLSEGDQCGRQRTKWQPTLTFTEDINRLEEEVWIKAIVAKQLQFSFSAGLTQ